MKGKIFSVLLALATSVVVVGCAGMQAPKQPMQFQPYTFKSTDYTRKVNNFQVIVDTSMTMAINDQYKFQSAKNFVGALNQSIPEGLGYNAGLRTFGHHPKQSTKLTELVYGMTNYSTSGFQQGLDGVKYAGGNSPLPEAIKAAGNDLKGAQGKSALIIVSDGLQMDKAPAEMEALKAEMGDNICAYTVFIGDDPAGQKLLEKVAQASGCGFATTGSALSNQNNMAAFVERALLDRKGPCPDGDGDGVCDDRDQCPGTPRGEMVDEVGCTLKLTLHINFDFDKAEIKPEFKPDLDRAAKFIVKYKDVPYIVIAGHTDSVGEEAYNKDLSMRRAQAVIEYLTTNYDINAKRLVARGYGESRPVADNSTPEGRYENRRVEVICCVIVPPEY